MAKMSLSFVFELWICTIKSIYKNIIFNLVPIQLYFHHKSKYGNMQTWT